MSRYQLHCPIENSTCLHVDCAFWVTVKVSVVTSPHPLRTEARLGGACALLLQALAATGIRYSVVRSTEDEPVVGVQVDEPYHDPDDTD